MESSNDSLHTPYHYEPSYKNQIRYNLAIGLSDYKQIRKL